MDAILQAIADKVPWHQMPCVLVIVGVLALVLLYDQRNRKRNAKAFEQKDQMIADAYQGKDRRRRGRGGD